MASESLQAPVEAKSVLTGEALSPIVDAAMAHWIEALGSDDTMAVAHDVTFQITDFDDLTLGRTIGDTILIDTDTAGYGWFMDETPYDDSKFSIKRGDGELLATADSKAYGQMDLLTVVTYELGHELGLGHSDNHRLMGLQAWTLACAVSAPKAISKPYRNNRIKPSSVFALPSSTRGVGHSPERLTTFFPAGTWPMMSRTRDLFQYS